MRRLLCSLFASLYFVCFNPIAQLPDARGSDTFSINSAYLQYRNYHPGHNSPRITTWMDFHLNGEPLQTDRIQKIQLFDDDQNRIPTEGLYFWYSTGYYTGNWNNTSQTLDYTGPVTEGGYSVRFPEGNYLNKGNYTYVATTDQGQTINYPVYFPGMTILPYISEDSIAHQWNPDGTLTLTWDKPNGEFDEYRIVFYNEENGQEQLYVKLPNDKNTLTLSGDILGKAILKDEIYVDDNYYMRMSFQTRSYENGMNYARAVTSYAFPIDDEYLKPRATTLYTPENSTSNPVSFTWKAIFNSTWYYVWIKGSKGAVHKKWHKGSDVTQESTCSLTLESALDPDEYTWWVQTYNDNGSGPWSSAMSFSIGQQGTTPAAATLTSPNSSVSDADITYTWNAVPDAAWYYLWVDDETENKIKKWYTAQQAGCESGTGNCSATPSTPLDAGNAKWWIQTWNDYGYGPWSSAMSFKVEQEQQGTTPAAATLTSPNSSVSNAEITYTWNVVPDATWYYLWVDDKTGNKIKKWYTAQQAGCESGTGTCSVTPSTTLDAGNAKWWIQTWNDYGDGHWSSGMNFSVSTPNKCGAYVAPGVWREFDCYNLAAIGKTTEDDPFTPTWRLIGGYWQWGRKGPDPSEWYDTNTEHFAHGPTGPDDADVNWYGISEWDDDLGSNGHWSDYFKGTEDPCPSGYEVPRIDIWEGVTQNNTKYSVGTTWTSDSANYSSGTFLGDDLMLPAAGWRGNLSGALYRRGSVGNYWSRSPVLGSILNSFNSDWADSLTIEQDSASTASAYRLMGYSVRCIKQ